MKQKQSLVILCLSVLLLTGTGIEAQTVVANKAESKSGIVKASPREQWRLGGDDDELFFGTVARIHTGPDGNIYILDGQLSQIQVISPEGEHLRSLGSEGDGPGEVRRPNDFFISDDGTVNILNGFPGKVVKIAADGTPSGAVAFSVDGSKAQFGVLIRGLETDEGMILGGINMSFGGSAVSEQTYYIARCDPEGNQINRLAEKLHSVDYSDFHMEEKAMDFAWSRVATGPDGKLYLAKSRDEYAIEVMDPDGTVHRVIKRDFQSPPRTDRQNKIAIQIIEAVAANYPAPLKGTEIEKTEPVVGNLFVTEDNRLWVQADIGDDALPEGTWAMFDVFDTEGQFEKQVALAGSYNRYRDAVFILPDGRAIVVTGALDAFLNQMGAGGGEENAIEIDPLEIICFELEM
jgi:6-bladed beta-propeller